MKTTNIILIAIAILVIALIGVAAYSVMNDQVKIELNTTSDNNNTTKFINIGTINANDLNKTVGDNSPRNVTNMTNNTTIYKVYVPQTDSYVSVIGEKYDDEVNRWYTYDAEGVRYYNTRINH